VSLITGLEHGLEWWNGLWNMEWTTELCTADSTISHCVLASFVSRGGWTLMLHTWLCAGLDPILRMFYIPTSTASFPCQYGLGPRVNESTYT